ncbi:exodeoxyribonuclease VII large subunit [Arcanobacterium bovis]|uniref:Exodeoxyribonuclease 7 large subunit n=1 Tax=Arcanobacterium bovis TaxID=2529275 RepID=A0A4Q9V229_9ACTO|nr:exodeoxyribonuclease VII large subunit [Arcanobacterium bovis]TBW23691.1 exodeoxyribonuclease VII large subunit [Arcanobacterium bovis]
MPTNNSQANHSQSAIPPHLPQLAAQTTPDHPWPLRLLSAKIAEYVQKMSRLWVEGEIITLVRRPNAKLQYFTLADLEEKVSINVKIFTHNLPEGIDQGSRVIICAKPDFWTGNGSLTLHADEVRAVGIGDILARIEQLKNRLAAEGLFSPQNKKPLPFLPRKIGLICGRNTKAKHDVVVNATARWADVNFEIREVQVQGNGSVEAMIPALAELDSLPDVDVIVFARGGGSVEDLLPFSDERLIRAVAAAQTPVVSAIGHETDNPLLDYVADFRASTPTDAARKIVPDVVEERNGLREAVRRGRLHLDNQLHFANEQLTQLRNSPAFAHPQRILEVRAEELQNLVNLKNVYFEREISKKRADLDATIARLRTLSPQSTLKRGYTILLKSDGSLVRHTTDAPLQTRLDARLADGTIHLVVTDGKTSKTDTLPHQQPNPENSEIGEAK